VDVLPTDTAESRGRGSRDDSADRMNGLMRGKMALLREMRELSMQAGTFICEDGVEPLDNIMDKKRELIREIDFLDGRFLSAYEEFKASPGHSDEERRRILAELRENASGILALADEIKIIDEGLLSELLRFRGEIASDLSQIKRQKHISGLYERDGARPGGSETYEYSSGAGIDVKK